MLGITAITIVFVILMGMMLAAIGTEITIGLSTLLWIMLAAFVAGAVWTILLLAAKVDDTV